MMVMTEGGLLSLEPEGQELSLAFSVTVVMTEKKVAVFAVVRVAARSLVECATEIGI